MSCLIFTTVFSNKNKWKDINNKHSLLKKGPVGSTTFLSSYKCVLFLLTTHSIPRKWNSSYSKYYYLQWNNLITYWMKFIVFLSEILKLSARLFQWHVPLSVTSYMLSAIIFLKNYSLLYYSFRIIMRFQSKTFLSITTEWFGQVYKDRHSYLRLYKS